jgi:hypothetical protein
MVTTVAIFPYTVERTSTRVTGCGDSRRPSGVRSWMSTGKVPALSAFTSISTCSF